MVRPRARLRGLLGVAADLAIVHVAPLWAWLLIALAQRARRQSGWHG
jgi:hypothetical protein